MGLSELKLHAGDGPSCGGETIEIGIFSVAAAGIAAQSANLGGGQPGKLGLRHRLQLTGGAAIAAVSSWAIPAERSAATTGVAHGANIGGIDAFGCQSAQRLDPAR